MFYEKNSEDVEKSADAWNNFLLPYHQLCDSSESGQKLYFATFNFLGAIFVL